MKVLVTKETGTQITENIQIHIPNIKEVYLEEWLTKSDGNKSYFVIYLDISQNEAGKLSWLEITIPFDYIQQNEKVVPEYEKKITSCDFYLNDQLVNCELQEDERLILINVCVKTLLEEN